MQFQYDDGGREAAGFKGKAGDCVTRAISIAAQRPYSEVYEAINARSGKVRNKTRKATGKSSARLGVYKQDYRPYLEALGWKWVPTMAIGTGCKVHMRSDELPVGRIIVKLTRHLAAVIDGVLHDTYEDTRDGRRCVYGYFIQEGAK